MISKADFTLRWTQKYINKTFFQDEGLENGLKKSNSQCIYQGGSRVPRPRRFAGARPMRFAGAPSEICKTNFTMWSHKTSFKIDFTARWAKSAFKSEFRVWGNKVAFQRKFTVRVTKFDFKSEFSVGCHKK